MPQPKKPCKHCGKRIDTRGLQQHERSCKAHRPSQPEPVRKSFRKKKCELCGKMVGVTGMGSHLRACRKKKNVHLLTDAIPAEQPETPQFAPLQDLNYCPRCGYEVGVLLALMMSGRLR